MKATETETTTTYFKHCKVEETLFADGQGIVTADCGDYNHDEPPRALLCHDLPTNYVWSEPICHSGGYASRRFKKLTKGELS